jgi:hypothetical protein
VLAASHPESIGDCAWAGAAWWTRTQSAAAAATAGIARRRTGRGASQLASTGGVGADMASRISAAVRSRKRAVHLSLPRERVGSLGEVDKRSSAVDPPFADLQAMIVKAETALQAFTPDEVNGWAGKDLDLQIGRRRLSFTSETFILSFSLPHFHFHAVTAYDILRSRGVPLGKRDYEGRLRTRSR